MEKPITMEIEEFKNNIINLINNSSVPAFAMDMIMRDLSNEISVKAKAIAEQDKAIYLAELEKEEE